MSNSVRPHRRQPTRLPRPWDSPAKNTGVGCHFLLQCMKVKSESEVAQSCQTLSDPMDCSPPGSSVHGIFQARVLEWGAIAFSAVLCYVVTICLAHLLDKLGTTLRRSRLTQVLFLSRPHQPLISHSLSSCLMQWLEFYLFSCCSFSESCERNDMH